MYFFSLSEAVPWTGWTESQLKSEESQEQYFFNIPLVSVSNCAVWVLFLCSCYVFMFMFNTLSACVFDLLPVSWPDPVGFGILDTSALNSVWIIGFLTFACLLTTRLPFPFGLLPVNFINKWTIQHLTWTPDADSSSPCSTSVASGCCFSCTVIHQFNTDTNQLTADIGREITGNRSSLITIQGII